MPDDSDKLEALHRKVFSMAESVGHGLDPHDDWVPVLLCQDAEGAVTAIAMLPDMMRDAKAKDLVINNAFPEILRKANADSAAFLSTAWAAHHEAATSPAIAELIRPSQDPDRQEVLVVYCVTRNGERSVRAHPITRHPDAPPTLTYDPGQACDAVSGRFVEGLTRAFALSSQS